MPDETEEIRLPEPGVNPLVVLAYMLYELMVQLAGGVTAVHAKPMALEDDAVAVNPVGADGTVAHDPPDPPRVSALACDDGAELPAASTASTT